MDDATGEIKSMRQIDSSGLYTAPVADEQAMYIQARDGSLYAVDIAGDDAE